MSIKTFFGVRAQPKTVKPPSPVATAASTVDIRPTEKKPTSIQEILRAADEDLRNPHPEVLAAYVQASAILVLAKEVKGLCELMASGEAGITVGVDK